MVDAATKENGFAFDYLPKPGQDALGPHLDDMYNDKIKGMLPSNEWSNDWPGHEQDINALKKADWLVVGEIYEDETSEFWRAPGITDRRTKEHKKTVYRLPCAGVCRKRRQHD